MKKILFIIGIVVAFAACVKIDQPTPFQDADNSTSVQQPVNVKARNINENNFVNIENDSAYVKTTNSGMLYKLFYEKVNDAPADSLWGEDVWDTIKKIKIDGVIDAIDFTTLKWNFRNIENVDISGTKIVSYGGIYGTNEGYYEKGNEYSEYLKDEIPIGAFFYWGGHFFRSFPNEFYDEGMKSLRSIKLPDGIKVIRRNAFARAYNLKEINVPEGVEQIDMVAFRYCENVEKLYLPSTIKYIGWLAFTEMYALKEVHIKATNMPKEERIINETFGNKLDGYQIGDESLRGCVIDEYHPMTNATLYVPKGCKDNYKKWEIHFKDIVEE